MKQKSIFWLFTCASQQLGCQFEKLTEIKHDSKTAHIKVMQENYTVTHFMKD